MKLLLDANISWRITTKLKAHFDDYLHMDFMGLIIPASDIAIWQFALTNHCIIITNDEDFLNFMNLKGFPSKIVLLKTGNQSNSYLTELIIKQKENIRQLAESKEYGLLEIY